MCHTNWKKISMQIWNSNITSHIRQLRNFCETVVYLVSCYSFNGSNLRRQFSSKQNMEISTLISKFHSNLMNFIFNFVSSLTKILDYVVFNCWEQFCATNPFWNIVHTWTRNVSLVYQEQLKRGIKRWKN